MKTYSMGSILYALPDVVPIRNPDQVPPLNGFVLVQQGMDQADLATCHRPMPLDQS